MIVLLSVSLLDSALIVCSLMSLFNANKTLYGVRIKVNAFTFKSV